ncbi:MAG: lysostaphin resistance A-like protein [Actinomycetota bacterium]
MSEIVEGSVKQNRPRLWRWIVGTLLIVLVWQGLGLVFTVGAARFFGFDLEVLFSTDDAGIAALRELPPWSAALTILVSYIPLFLVIMVVYRYIVNRPIKRLFTSFERYSWKRTWIGFAAFALITLVFGIGDIVINWDDYTWSWSATKFLPFLLVTLTLLPIQTTSEELLFRGWLQQWLDNGKKKQWTISLVGALLFALPHMANPEVAGNELFFPIISYGSVGFMLAWVTYRDKTLEMAIGAHFANNFLTSLVASTEDSALPTVSLFTTPEVAWAPAAVVSVIMVPIFIWLSGKWNAKVAA